MDAYVSGECGRAVYVLGDEAFIVDVDSPETEIPVPIGFAFRALAGATDVQELKSVSREMARTRLKSEWECDRGLRLILILLDESEFIEVRQEASAALAELIAKPSVKAFIKTRLYSYPLPTEADIDTALSVTKAQGPVENLLRDLLERQPSIVTHRQAWDALPDELFEHSAAREQFESRLVETGSFCELVEAGQDTAAINAVIFKCLKEFRDAKNFREVILRWVKDAPRDRPKDLWKTLESPSGNNHRWKTAIGANQRPLFAGYASYQNVLKQQAAIIDQLRQANVRLARKFTDELVHGQLENGGPEYATKSLCKLAQEAKFLGLHSLQLEWARRAAEISPEDARAHGQTADAYIYFSRFDEALRSLELCEKFGDRLFSVNGRARILKAQAKLDDALVAFVAAEAQFVEHKDVVFSWLGHAEVLRDMWLFEQSLQVYEETNKRFPDCRAARCGRAAVLTDMGRLEDALQGYQETLSLFGEDTVALNGRADVWKEMGRLDDALNAYDEIIVKFPNDSIPYCGRAEVLRLMGELEGASRAYLDARKRFPYISVPYSGAAEVLKDQHDYRGALQAYELAVQQFPFDSRARNGRANVLKASGNHKEALAAYDETVRLFPYDLISLNGRADILKELADFDSALKLYDQIIERWPGFQSAKHAKAAILVVLERYSEAEKLLRMEPPQTRDDWIGYHVRGMILLRSGRTPEAVTHFTRGLMEIPYAKERRFYENALAIARLSEKEFPIAAKLLERTAGPIANVIQMHAFAASGRTLEARQAFIRAQANCPSTLIELRDELASRFRLRSFVTAA